MRTSIKKDIENSAIFKHKLLTWSQQFREVCFLDSNDYPQKYSCYDCILAVDAFTSIVTDYHKAFDDLESYQQVTKDWLFGWLSYDLKNDVEDLASENFDGLEFSDLFFFQPRKLFLLKDGQLEILYLNNCFEEFEHDFEEICSLEHDTPLIKTQLNIEQRISKNDYFQKVEALQDHVHRGDIYEANFCIEFFANNVEINPKNIFKKLNSISKSPQAAFFKVNNHFLLCASPERYVMKTGEKIISQPIKGTSPRFEDFEKDLMSKVQLAKDPKERSENIMVTDLVRNDLSRTAQKGSVQVEELCGLYSFSQVHQMISTVSSTIDSQYSPVSVLRTSFPMGSMTGMPKISVMEIIEKLEETKRGLYSGAVGYFCPKGDFDFNVVIRSILYNRQNKYLSFSVGSAITAQSIIENEYEECLLKAKAMRQVLSSE